MIDSIVNLTRYFMILEGLWKLPLFEDRRNQKLYRIYSLSVQTIFNLFTLSVIIRLIQIILGDGSPAKIFSSITIAIIVSMSNLDMMIFIKNEIWTLFADVLEEEARILNSPDPAIRSSYLGQTKYYRITAMSQAISTFFSAAMFVASNFYKEITGSFREHEAFMYEMWFPFDRDEYRRLVILINVIVVSLGFIFNVASRIIPLTLIVFVDSQLRVLQIRFQNVFADHHRDEEPVRVRVVELIRKHQKLIEFVKALNEKIKNVIFMEYVLSALNVATALLQVITVRTVGEMAFSFFHLSLLVLQIFILGWSTNEINIQSIGIATAVYNSNWMDQSEAMKKTMRVVMMRAQKPLALTIGPFKAINLETALVTMKGAYTYASVMIQKYT